MSFLLRCERRSRTKPRRRSSSHAALPARRLPPPLCRGAHRAAELTQTRQGIVLLKNDNAALPLRRGDLTAEGSLALVGPQVWESNWESIWNSG